MRTTIISIVLFSLLLFGVILNGFFVRNVSNELIEYANLLSTPCEKDLQSLEAYWIGKRDWLALSIPSSYLDNIEKVIISMHSSYKSDNLNEYNKDLALFRQAAQTIDKAERFSIKNIL